MNFTGSALLKQIAHTPTRVKVALPGTNVIFEGTTTGEDAPADHVMVRFDASAVSIPVPSGRII